MPRKPGNRFREPGTDRTASEFPAKGAGNPWQSCQSPGGTVHARPVFHEVSRAERPSQQTANSRQTAPKTHLSRVGRSGQSALVTNGQASMACPALLGDALLGGVGDCLGNGAQGNAGELGRDLRNFPCHGELEQATRTDVLAVHRPHSPVVHTFTPGGTNPVRHFFSLRAVLSAFVEQFRYRRLGRVFEYIPARVLAKALDTPRDSIV